jgi:hypothetical protein
MAGTVRTQSSGANEAIRSARRHNDAVIDNVYDEVRACVSALRHAGLGDAADLVEGCLYGSTSGEILTDLGAALVSTLRTNEAMSGPLRRRVSALLDDVDRRLRAVGHITPVEWRPRDAKSDR